MKRPPKSLTVTSTEKRRTSHGSCDSRQISWLIYVNSMERWIPNQPYQWIRTLAEARMHGDGWVWIGDLEQKIGSQTQYLDRCRENINPLLISNSGSREGMYRLDLDSHRIQVV